MEVTMKKKRKIAVVMVMSFALAGTVLTGCGEKTQETGKEDSANAAQEMQLDTSVEETYVDEVPGTEAEIAEAEVSKNTAEKYEDNFAVDRQTAKEFAEKIKAAVAEKDLEALADLTAFPVYVGLPDTDVIETREDFLALGADAVFTKELVKSIETADIENLDPSMAGFPISDGGACINFGVSVDGVLAINGINY